MFFVDKSKKKVGIKRVYGGDKLRIDYERDCPSTKIDWSLPNNRLANNNNRLGNNNHTSGPTTTTQTGPSSTTDWPTTTTQTGPSPVPSPIGRSVITEIPLPSCCSLLTVLVVVVSHVVLHSLSPYFICLNTSVQYVHSVYLCLSVILSINIKNTTKHVLSFILCLCVIMSVNIKNTAQHVFSVIICLSVILSISINFSFSMYVLSVSVTYMKSGGCRLR